MKKWILIFFVIGQFLPLNAQLKHLLKAENVDSVVIRTIDWDIFPFGFYTIDRKAFDEFGISFEVERQYVPALFSISQGYEAMGILMEQMPELTAVFAMSDTMALGAIRAIRDRGLRVPEDISVLGFDGIELGNYVSPKLTTIRQDREVIAKRSVEILLENIVGLNNAVHETVPFQVIVGESAQRCR